MTLPFVKMHAHGDDFVVVDLRGKPNPVTGEVARRLGDRRRGIGFNQLALVLDCDDAAARVVFWNRDGSPLATCGSASRGIADLLMRETGMSAVVLRSSRGLLHCERDTDQRISIDMGRPLFGWQDMALTEPADTRALPLPGAPAACSMGNPHCTFFVDDASTIDVAAIGSQIETDALFAHGTNVHFVQVLDRGRIRLRIWERGGGIPLGSGSCCCGAAVNGIRRGLLDSTVEVECDGGAVKVQWNGRDGVILSGPVAPVFRGTIAGRLLENQLFEPLPGGTDREDFLPTAAQRLE